MGNSKQENDKWFRSPPLRFWILGFLFSGIVLSGILYATGMFSSLLPSPPWKTVWGAFSGRLSTQIAWTCGTDRFLKGFNTNYTPVCVAWDGNSNLNPQYNHPVSGYPISAPVGQYTHGKFETYFKNLVGVCPGNTIVKGFASDGWKYCVDPATPNSIATPHTPVVPSWIAWPTKPTGESTGGVFQTFFTTMFTTCAGTTVINGINSNGSPNCVPAPVNCVGYWSDTNTCSAPCGPGTKQQVYAITTPNAYGWLACSNNSWDTQWGTTSCNMGACAIAGVCGLSANSCEKWTALGYSAWLCGWNQTWSCIGLNGGSNIDCNIANEACAIPDCPANIDLQWDSDRTWNTPLVDANPPAGFQLPSGNPWCYYEIQNGDRYCGSYDRVTWQRYNTWKCCWDHDYNKAINGGDC